jgi:hypothetical protein
MPTLALMLAFAAAVTLFDGLQVVGAMGLRAQGQLLPRLGLLALSLAGAAAIYFLALWGSRLLLTMRL